PRSVRWLPKNSDARYLWDHLRKQLQPFPAQFSGESGEPRDISTRMRQAIGIPSRNWVFLCHDDNGDRLGRLLGCADPPWASNNKHIDLELYQFGHKAWVTIALSLNVAILNQDIFPFDITEISQPLPESLDT